VITKGAGRIAEVSGRSPWTRCRQADGDRRRLQRPGLVDENEARRRRAEISQEADFYGSMDGASKFVRGDAIAGILILVINIVGGSAHRPDAAHMSLADAARNYTLLAIGDGLVARFRRW